MTSGGAVSPENRSNEEIRADLAHVRSFGKATLLNAPAASMRLMRDVEPLLARLAAVEREAEVLAERHDGARLDASYWRASAERLAVERDAALARIAAVEAQRDALAVTIANEAQTLRAYHVGPLAAGNPVDAAHLADHLDAQLDAALAASPTPTGPEPTWLTTDCGRCDNERRAKLPWPERLSQRMIVCPDCGNKRCPRAAFHGNACTGSNAVGQPGSAYEFAGPATPEPTEETP